MLSQFIQSIETLSFPLQQLPTSLRLAKSSAIEMYYAPFDHVNTAAKVVICGITPGLQQAKIALYKTQQLLGTDTPLTLVSQQAKETASFAGPI